MSLGTICSFIRTAKKEKVVCTPSPPHRVVSHPFHASYSEHRTSMRPHVWAPPCERVVSAYEARGSHVVLVSRGAYSFRDRVTGLFLRRHVRSCTTPSNSSRLARCHARLCLPCVTLPCAAQALRKSKTTRHEGILPPLTTFGRLCCRTIRRA